MQRALLDQISEKSHVYGLPISLGQLLSNGFEPQKIGLSSASTFTGFCATHDKQIFSAIENTSIEQTREHAFLLAYRALCREVHAKRCASRMANTLRQIDRGMPRAAHKPLQMMVGGHIKGNELGLRDLEIHKQSYDSVLSSRDFSNVRSEFIEMSDLPPLMVSGVYFPEESFNGEILQDLTDVSTVMQLMTFSVVAAQGVGWAVFSWLDSGTKINDRLMESLANVDQSQLAESIVQFSFEYFENVYISPIWWDSLDSPTKTILQSRILSGSDAFVGRDRARIVTHGCSCVTSTARISMTT